MTKYWQWSKTEDEELIPHIDLIPKVMAVKFNFWIIISGGSSRRSQSRDVDSV